MRPAKMQIKNSISRGFTLVEMAVVLVIAGLLLGGLLLPLSAQLDLRNNNETSQTITNIKEAIYGFAILNGRLPCPTIEADPENTNYGLENCSIATEAYLPWKTLGVSPTDAWGTPRKSVSDSWNGHWRYKIDNNFKTTTLFSNNILAPATATVFDDDLLVRDSLANNLTPTNGEMPVVIVYSAGKNLARDGLNTNEDSEYQSDTPSTNFDDVLVWISRPVLVNRLATANRMP